MKNSVSMTNLNIHHNNILSDNFIKNSPITSRNEQNPQKNNFINFKFDENNSSNVNLLNTSKSFNNINNLRILEEDKIHKKILNSNSSNNNSNLNKGINDLDNK